jgi:hypothetical protein
MSERCRVMEDALGALFGGPTPRRHRKSAEDIECERVQARPGFGEAYQRFLRHPDGGHGVGLHQLAGHPVWIEVNDDLNSQEG